MRVARFYEIPIWYSISVLWLLRIQRVLVRIKSIAVVDNRQNLLTSTHVTCRFSVECHRLMGYAM